MLERQGIKLNRKKLYRLGRPGERTGAGLHCDGHDLARAAAAGAVQCLAGHDPDGPPRRTIRGAAAVVYLASAASTDVTGAILSIDGGYTAW